jgi:hypothetical protein
MALTEASVARTIKDLSAGLRAGTVKIFTVPESSIGKLKQSAKWRLANHTAAVTVGRSQR